MPQKTLSDFAPYARQMLIPEIGQHGQEKLQKAHVVIIGAGGLGTPAATYVAAAGIGHITIIDQDTVSLSNVNRQFFYGIQDIGKGKAELLATRLTTLHPHIQCTAKHITIATSQNFLDNNTLLEQVIGLPQCILLCVDNVETRLAINAYALHKGIPLIDAGVDGFYGYIFATNPHEPQAPCLACISHLQAKEKHLMPAIGATCGVLGSLQASACLMLLLGMPNPYANCILQYDGKLGEFEKIPLRKNPACFCYAK